MSVKGSISIMVSLRYLTVNGNRLKYLPEGLALSVGWGIGTSMGHLQPVIFSWVMARGSLHLLALDWAAQGCASCWCCSGFAAQLHMGKATIKLESFLSLSWLLPCFILNFKGTEISLYIIWSQKCLNFAEVYEIFFCSNWHVKTTSFS